MQGDVSDNDESTAKAINVEEVVNRKEEDHHDGKEENDNEKEKTNNEKEKQPYEKKIEELKMQE